MSLVGRTLRKMFGGRGSSSRHTQRPGRRVSASYDAAQTTGENENHWYWADALNANAANSATVRQTLRERARYEAQNNGYLGGLVDKLAKDLIGRGPRPQLRIPGVGRDVSRSIEWHYLQWARASGLNWKLRILDQQAVVDGEGFGILVHNPRLDPGNVQLDLRLYECDQVATPFIATQWGDALSFDGGRQDEFGNVTEWHFLKVHPGSDIWVTNFLDHDVIDSRNVIHWFTPRRAGQLRGVPEVLSSLTLFGYLRRYTLATLVAAETAANIAGVLETDATADTGEGPSFESLDDVPIPRGGLLTLPGGWKATAFKAEQPVTAYGEFKTQILTEAGQPVGAPQNISTGSSAAYNYSSGRLDHGIYQRGIGVRRGDLRDRVLDQIFRSWLAEASLVPGLIPDGLPLRSLWSWEWYFDGFTSIDPQKDAITDKTRLETGTTTYAEIFAERGQDWEEAFEQQAREQARRVELGLTRGPGRPPGPAKAAAEEVTRA
jgi:lambda family phage portal protein